MDTFAHVLRDRAENPATRGHGLTLLADDGTEDTRLSFEALDRAARRIAQRIQRASSPGDRVLLLFPTGAEFVESFLGCLYSGRIAVPVFPPDPRNLRRTLPRLRRLVANAEPTLALAPAANLLLLRAGAQLVPELRSVRWLSPADAEREDPDRWSDGDLHGDAVAFLQYTSGSTSDPKGVMVTHRNLVENSAIIHALAEHSPESVYVSWLPMYHDMGLIGGLLQPIYMGGHGVLLTPFAFLRRPVRWLEAITKYRGTTTPFPNFALELCVKRVTEQDKARLDLSSLRVACNGAEPVREDTLRRFSAAFERCGFRDVAHYPAYGLAESTLLVSGGKAGAGARVLRLAKDALARDRVELAEDGSPLVSCGAVARGHTCVVVDPETRQPCEPDRVGEIWISGPCVARGYWRNPDATADTFRGRLAAWPDLTFLRTGDLGFLRDGELYVTGRSKDLIIVGGANVYPQDVERAAEAVEGADLRPGCSAAFSCTDEDHQERLVLVAEVRETRRTPIGDALRAVREAIVDEVGIVPHRVVLIEQGTIDKTSSGKLRRGAVRSRYLEGSLRVVASE